MTAAGITGSPVPAAGAVGSSHRSELLRRVGGELVGTAVLVAIGTGTIVAGERAGFLPLPLLTLGWFLAVLVPVLLFARTSGAHLNPAVTVALAASGRFAWRRVPAYVGSQIAGAFLGSLTVLAAVGRGVRLGADVPAPGFAAWVFPTEFLFTGLLVVSVLYIVDRGEGRLRWRLFLPAIVVGVAVWLAGPWTAISLNPARLIAPAVLAGTYDSFGLYLAGQSLGALTAAALGRFLPAPGTVPGRVTDSEPP